MPATSKAQFRMMAAAEHNPAFAAKVGIAPSKAAEFVDTANFKKLPERKKKRKTNDGMKIHDVIARGG